MPLLNYWFLIAYDSQYVGSKLWPRICKTCVKIYDTLFDTLKALQKWKRTIFNGTKSMENNFTRGDITQNFGWLISSWFMKEKQFEFQNLVKIWPRLCKNKTRNYLTRLLWYSERIKWKTNLTYTWGEAFFSAHKR